MALQIKELSATARSGNGSILYTYTLRVTENSIDPVKNCSHVTVQAILRQDLPGIAFSGYRTGVSCSVDGKTLFSDYCRRTVSGSQEHIFYTWQGQLPHGPDGKATVQIGGRLWLTDEDLYTPPAVDIPQRAVELTAIPRFSQVGATDGFIGSNSAVVITPTNRDTVHTLQYIFGEESGYIRADGSTSETPEMLETTALSFAIPESFYAQIPDRPWQDCTLVCNTYLNGLAIGRSQTAFRVTAEESRCGPQAQWTLQDTEPKTLALTGNAGVLIRYMSRLRVTVNAQARRGARITQCLVWGTEMTDGAVEFPQVESNRVTAIVKDSRGYLCRLEQTVPMIPYVVLTCNASVARTAPTTGQAVLQIAGNCYCGSFGVSENTLRIFYRIGPEDGTLSDWQALECAIDPDHTYSLTVPLDGLDYTKAYRLEVRSEDALTAEERALSVLPGVPVYHWKRDGFYFHVPVEFDSTVSGAYIRSHTLYGAQRLAVTVAVGQTVLLFGANGGLCGVFGSAGTWWGSPEVSVQAEEGRVTLTFAQPVSGSLLLISDRQFCIE